MKYFYDQRVAAMIAFDDTTNEIYQLQSVVFAIPSALSSPAVDTAPPRPAKLKGPKKTKKTKSVREFQEKDLFPTRKNKATGGCPECGSPSKHKKTCSRSSAATKPHIEPDEKRVDDETAAKIVAMRKDGYSANFIATQIGMGKIIVGRAIKAAGILDTSGKADDRYPLRCGKCKEFGHDPGACKTGDALDQLDKAEGWTERDPNRFTREEFGKVKSAHFQHGIEPSMLRMSWPKQGLHEVKKAIGAKNYDDYLADTSTDFIS